MNYNRTMITGFINTAERKGVRLLESDFMDNQAKGSYEGVMIFRGEFSEILDSILHGDEGGFAIQKRLDDFRLLDSGIRNRH